MEKQPSSQKIEKGKKIPCVINGVDLTNVLPTPLWVTFDDEQKAKIQEFKKAENVVPHLKPEHTDYYISRFLVARKWDMKLSTELFANAMVVREAEGIDSILETFPRDFWYKALTGYWPTSIHPDKPLVAKDGCPVMYERIGLVNPKLADLIPLEVCVRHHLYNVEIMERENRKIVDKEGFSAGTILIENLEDLSTSHMYGKVVKLITGIAARDEVSYPESIRKIYIVNPPAVFSMVWAIMKPFIEERTQAKFSFGTAKEFKDDWEKIIGMDQLPKSLGGTASWELPAAGNIKNLVPSSLAVVEIPRRGSHGFEVTVKANHTFKVEFLVKSGKDIGFALYIKTGSEADSFLSKAQSSKDITKNTAGRKEIEEYKLKKIDEENTPFLAKVTPKEDTSYIVFFDNTDSPMLGRDLAILHYIEEPFEVKK